MNGQIALVIEQRLLDSLGENPDRSLAIDGQHVDIATADQGHHRATDAAAVKQRRNVLCLPESERTFTRCDPNCSVAGIGGVPRHLRER